MRLHFVALRSCRCCDRQLLAGCEQETIVVAPEAPRVSVMHPEQRELSDHEEFNGWMAADKTVEVRSRGAGATFKKIHFTDGQYVKKGDLLFELDPRPFQAEIGKTQRQLEESTKRKRSPPTRKKRGCGLLETKGGASMQQVEKAEADALALAAQISAAKNEIVTDRARSRIFADHGRHRRPRQQSRIDRGQPGQRRRQRSAADDDRVGRSDPNHTSTSMSDRCSATRRASAPQAESCPICWRT